MLALHTRKQFILSTFLYLPGSAVVLPILLLTTVASHRLPRILPPRICSCRPEGGLPFAIAFHHAPGQLLGWR